MDNSTQGMSEKLVMYLDGEITGQEKADLEKQLDASPELQEELSSLRQTRAAIQYFGLKDKVAGVHQQMMLELAAPVIPISRGRKILRYSMAAAAAVILLVGSWLAYSFFSLSPDKVFASGYHTYELSNMRSGDGNSSTAIEKAFEGNQFDEVLKLYQEGAGAGIRDRFLTAVAALEKKNDPLAIRLLKEQLESNRLSSKPVYNDDSEYYLALGYVRNKDYDFALPLLQKIKDDPEHTYNSKVTTRLIRKVKLLKWR